jgi:hypothetical protein
MAVKYIEGKVLPKKDTKLYTHITLTRLRRINLKRRGR